MTSMAVAAKKLSIGDLVEIDGRQYDVVSDKAGGVRWSRRSRRRSPRSTPNSARAR